MMLKLTRKVSLLARNHKLHPNKPPILYSNLIGMPEPRIKPKWSSEFFERFWRFKISDTPINLKFTSPTGGDSGFLTPSTHTGEDSEFLIPPRTQAKIQNFWSPQAQRRNSEFLMSPITQAKIQNFWSPQEHSNERIQNFWAKTKTWSHEDSEYVISQTTSVKDSQ